MRVPTPAPTRVPTEAGTATPEALGPRGATGDLFVAAILTVVVFAPAFGLYRWYDDWMYVSAAGEALDRGHPAAFIWGAFRPHWSPISFAFELLNLWLMGWESDTLIRVVIALLALGGAVAFARLARRLGLGSLGVRGGIAVLLLHHINAAPFYSFDCYDQVAADLLTWIILGRLWTVAERQEPTSIARELARMLALLVPALLIKEQALAAVAGLAVLAGWFTWIEPGPVPLRRLLWRACGAGTVAAAGFAMTRAEAGLWFDVVGPYEFCLRCVPGNFGLLVGSLVVPGRTLELFQALTTTILPAGAVMGAALILAGGVALATLAALAIRGTTGGGWDRRGLLALLLLASSTCPTVVLSSARELYAHTGLFWMALAASVAIDKCVRAISRPVRRLRWSAAAMVGLYLLALGVGLGMNLDELRRTGERSRGWRERFVEAVAGLPAGSGVVVRGLTIEKAPQDYGLYRATRPGYLLAGVVGLAWRLPGTLLVIDERWLEGERGGPERARRHRWFLADFGGGGAIRVSEPAGLTGAGGSDMISSSH